MKTTLFLIAAWPIIVCSCNNSGQKKNDATAEIKSEQFSQDTIYQTSCTTHPETAYWIYMPGKDVRGVILVADPQGKGKVVLEKYRSLAKKYGVILVTSARIRNKTPLPEAENILTQIKTDVITRSGTGTVPVFLMGQSGGARLSAEMIVRDPSWAGMIGCGAGSPQYCTDSVFCRKYIGMAGVGDFNYMEMMSAMQLAGKNGLYLFWEGGHEWPPVDVMEWAWLGLDAVSEFDPGMNIDSLLELMNKTGENANLSSWLMKHNAPYIHRTTQYFGKETGKLNDETTALYTDLIKEKEEQKRLVSFFYSEPKKWWTDKAEEWKAISAKEQKTVSDWYNLRMKSYAGIAGYMLSENALKQNDVKLTASILDIYRVIEPENPDPAFISAKFSILLGDHSKALDWLLTAVDLGYSDYETWVSDPILNAVRDSARFVSLNDIMRTRQ